MHAKSKAKWILGVGGRIDRPAQLGCGRREIAREEPHELRKRDGFVSSIGDSTKDGGKRTSSDRVDSSERPSSPTMAEDVMTNLGAGSGVGRTGIQCPLLTLKSVGLENFTNKNQALETNLSR